MWLVWGACWLWAGRCNLQGMQGTTSSVRWMSAVPYLGSAHDLSLRRAPSRLTPVQPRYKSMVVYISSKRMLHS